METTSTIADRCGCSREWVTRLATELEVGTLVKGLAFTAAEAKRLEKRIRFGQARGPGRNVKPAE